MKRKVNNSISIVFAILFQLICFVSNAQWSTDPNVNNPICTAIDNQNNPVIVSDGAGGAIVAWFDFRSGTGGTNWDIYVQRINASGTVQWVNDGVSVCNEIRGQDFPSMVSDGSGGAIITWEDNRLGANYDIYVQHISAAGAIQWDSNGVMVCNATGDQRFPVIVSDGLGGAIITWNDFRNGTGNSDIYSQRINASGVVQWATNGVGICSAASDQTYQAMISDGAGGYIIAWQDNRNGNDDIYAQLINASGIAQWVANGVSVCNALYDQSNPSLSSDGSGGAIIAWQDLRTGIEIYAQRINAAGILQWNASGVVISTANESQIPEIVSDGQGGAVLTWCDRRNSTDFDVYAQRINAQGIVQWVVNGVVVSADTNDQRFVTLISDSLGGAYITWEDVRNAASDIYAQRIDSSGVVQWTANGVAISTATGYQAYPVLVSDGANNVIIAWMDSRAGSAFDIYVQRIPYNGVIGIDEASDNSLFTVYPNPSNGRFTIHSIVAGQYSIVNEQNQIVKQFHLDHANNYTEEIEELGNGIYFVTGVVNGQMVKQVVLVIN